MFDIKFTCEEEINNIISFLDISITRVNNKLITSLFFYSVSSLWNKVFTE